MWRSYDDIHNKKRKKLGASRANDLVYVFDNDELTTGFGKREKFSDWVEEIEFNGS